MPDDPLFDRTWVNARQKEKPIPFNTELSLEEQAQIADTSVLVRIEKAKAMFRKGATVDGVMSHTGLPRREAHRLMGEVRMEPPPAPATMRNKAPAMNGKGAAMQDKAKAKAKPAVEVEAEEEPEVRKAAPKVESVPAKKNKLADIVADWDDE